MSAGLLGFAGKYGFPCSLTNDCLLELTAENRADLRSLQGASLALLGPPCGPLFACSICPETLALAPEEGRQMEEMQRKLDQARAKFHSAVNNGDQAEQDSTWAAYMEVFFQVSQYNKAHGTKILPTIHPVC
ncbi:MAG: hypothetical protein C0473_01830, partial [Cyanobacteria bacterium DS3.002]|nr:hypothetical protein [Cyanobacteria bacterium DS3.002]